MKFRGLTAEEATDNVLKEQLPALIQMIENGDVHVDSKFNLNNIIANSI